MTVPSRTKPDESCYIRDEAYRYGFIEIFVGSGAKLVSFVARVTLCESGEYR